MRPFAAIAVGLGVLAAMPSSASAARIWADGSAVFYEASPRENNALELLRDGLAPYPFVEHAAPLEVGPGCVAGPAVICGVFTHATIRLGDRADVANVNSWISNVTIYGDAGADDVLAGGGSATAYGGDGDDTIRLAVDGDANGFGGAGHDRIGSGLGSSHDFFDGGPGADLLVSSSGGTSTVDGGDGPDEIIVVSRIVDVSGGNGADVIVAMATTVGELRVDGGGGDDVIDVSARPSGFIDTGSGHDFVDAFHGEGAAPETITCGAGRDVVWTDATDIVDRTCEHRYYGDPHLREEVAVARQKASALLAHTPDPRAAS